jgi:hypothetical protein
LWDFARTVALSDGARGSIIVPEKFVLLTVEDILLMQNAKNVRTVTQSARTGFYNCMYGALGGEISVGIAFDFGELISSIITAPLGLDLSLELSVGAEAGRVGQILLLSHKAFPKYKVRRYYDQNNQIYSAGRGSTHPVSLSNFQGNEHALALSAKLKAAASVGVPCISVAGIPLQLNLATIQGSIKGGIRFMIMEDPEPKIFPKVLDHDIAKQLHSYANPGREELKITINDWRTHLRDKIFNGINLTTNPQLNGLKNLLNQRLAFTGTGRASTDEVLTWLSNLSHALNELFKSQKISPLTINQASQTEILVQIKKFYDALTTAQISDVERARRKISAEQLKKMKASPRSHIRASIFSINTAAAASVGASAGHELSLGQVSTEFTAGAEAATSIKGSVNFVSYRYQTTNQHSHHGLVMYTQDTKITYSSVVCDASLEAGISVPATAWRSPSYGISKEKVLRQDMLYHSVNIYRGHENTSTITPLAGSGLSIGISIGLNMLLRLRNRQLSEETLNKRPFHRFLGTPRDLFLWFIESIPEQELADIRQQFPGNPCLIIEVNYRLSENIVFNRTSKGHIPNLVGLMFEKSRYRDNKDYYLPKDNLKSFDSMRCRVRLGDLASQSRDIFKLGFKVIVGVEAGLKKVKRAGNMFLEDIFNYPPYKDEPILTSDGQMIYDTAIPNNYFGGLLDPDTAVPPTVLLPHTFQID